MAPPFVRSLVSSLATAVRMHPVMGAALVVLALYWPCLTAGYLMDDFMHLKAFGLDAAQRPRDHWGLLTLFEFTSAGENPGMPWWASEGIQTRFWRPLSSLLGYADHELAPHNPVFAHLHSVAWLIASVASLRFLLRETCDQGQPKISWVALMTVLIYAMTCTHALPTLWIANRGALVAAALSWCSIGMYAKGQRGGYIMLDLVSSLMLGLALLAGEIAWVGVIQLGCFAVWGDARPWREKLERLWPHALLVGAWTLIYVQHGYGAQGGGYYLHPIADFGLFLKDAPLRLAQLSALALAFVPGELIQSADTQRWVIIGGGVLLLFATWCVKKVMGACSPNHQRSLRWMSLAGVLGTLPILGTQPNDRLLVPIMLSTSFFFATMIRYLGKRRSQRICLGLLGLGVLRHFVLAPGLTLVVNWILAQKSQAGNAANAALVATLADRPQAGLNFVMNSPGPAIAWSFDEHLEHLGYRPGPSEGWRFAAATRADLKWTRSSATSFELATLDGSSLANGLFGKLLRTTLDNSRDPLEVGRVIERGELRVEMLELNEEGQPSRVRFDLPTSQELEAARFYYWNGDAMVEVALPAMGESQEFPWKIGPMGI